MAFLDRFFNKGKRDRASINFGVERGLWSFPVGNYADSYLWVILRKIFQGLDNVRFVNNSTEPAANTLADFLTLNVKNITWQMWEKGYVILDETDPQNPKLIFKDVQKDAHGRVIEPRNKRWCVLYSDEYLYKGVSAFQILCENFKCLNLYKSSDFYLTSVLGAVGILSGDEVPINEADKEDLLKQFKRNLGISKDRFQFILSNDKLTYTPVELPVKELNLNEKINNEFLLLADFFGVPHNLLSPSGNNTYENVKQSVSYFYRTTIASLAEQALTLGRYYIRRSPWMISSNALTFTFDNVDLVDSTDLHIESILKMKSLSDTLQGGSAEKAKLNELITKKINDIQ